MSETGTTEAAAAAAESAASEPPVSSEPGPSSADTGTPTAGAADGDRSPLDTDLPEGMRQFDRSYVEKLRAEAAKHRTAAREAGERERRLQERYGAFESYDDADLQVWQQMATTWTNDPRQAAEQMRTIATNVLGDPTASAEQKAEAADQLEQLDNATSPQDVEKLIEDRIKAHDEQQQIQNQVNAIQEKLRSEGYERGTMEYASILWFATNDPETGGDIDKALTKWKNHEQRIVDNYVESVRSGKRPPVGADSGGQAAAPAGEPPKSVNEATRRAREFLAERSRGA